MIQASDRKLIESLNSKLSILLSDRKKETWVSATWITKLTGWDGNTKRQARKEGLIKYRQKRSGGYEYLLESLPSVFIRHSDTMPAEN